MHIFLSLVIAFFFSSSVCAEGTAKHPPAHHWSFETPLGTFDRAELQRGFQVYREVCSACHSLKQVRFRELQDIGFSEAQVKALAASYEVGDGPNEEGEMFTRPARPGDTLPPPFPNDEAARAANGGALPLDLSLITKAREGGAAYVQALLTGYAPCPKDVTLFEGRSYNPYFEGGQISMPPPLSKGLVVYADGTPATVKQMAHDVTAFLAWVAEPEMEKRKRLGIKVLFFLTILSGLLYALYKRIWRRVS